MSRRKGRKMEEVNITSWRELTLLQLGALLKDCTVDKQPSSLQQLDDWNPYCMKIWAAFQKKGRLRLRELSAVLNITPDRTEGGNHHA